MLIRNIKKSEVPQASALIHQAFQDDPLWTYLFPDEKIREMIGPKFTQSWVRYAINYGRAWATDDLKAVAIRRVGENYGMSLTREILSGMAELPFLLGPRAFKKLLLLDLELRKRFTKSKIKERHWYLWMIAVESALRGQGLGRSLMDHTFKEIDSEHSVSYLETTKESNVPMHMKNGFTLLTDSLMPNTNLRIWTMKR